MGAIATFSKADFDLQYPEFAYLSSGQIQTYWTIGQQYMINDGSGPVQDTATQAILLNLVTAHICQLFAPQANGQASSQLVGRITNASEGSVSVAVEFKGPVNAQWFQQTKYGAAWWEATKKYRIAMWRNESPARPIYPFGTAGLP